MDGNNYKQWATQYYCNNELKSLFYLDYSPQFFVWLLGNKFYKN